jgi:RHS repeat-associated protein
MAAAEVHPKRRDNETGLDYFGAKYFASVQGRFTGVDPEPLKMNHLWNHQDVNRYAYVSNNPLVFVDPNGEEKSQSLCRHLFLNPTSKPLAESW